MAAITKFDKTNSATIQTGIEEVLAKYGSTVGLEFKLGNIRFSDDVVVKTTLSIKIKGGKTAEEKMLDKMIKKLGLPVDKDGRAIAPDGTEVVGYDSDRFVDPFIIQHKGKRSRATDDYIKYIFKNKAYHKGLRLKK